MRAEAELSSSDQVQLRSSVPNTTCQRQERFRKWINSKNTETEVDLTDFDLDNSPWSGTGQESFEKKMQPRTSNPGMARETWHSPQKRKVSSRRVKPQRSLPPSLAYTPKMGENTGSPLTSPEVSDNNLDLDEMKMKRSLSRKNGVRYALKHHWKSQSPISISSESEASQTIDCDAGMDSNNLVLSSDSGERKFSVFLSSYEAWNEEGVTQCFRDLSPAVSALMDAAWNGQLDQLKDLLEDPENVARIQNDHARDCYERTPLHLGAACGHASVVELLLLNGAPVDTFDIQKNTPLCCAASCGSLPIVEKLLGHGANVNAGYEYGRTALHWAVQAGSMDCTAKLLEADAKQNPPMVYSETPAHIAASLGNAPILKLLIKHGADVSLCKGPHKSTCLHLAAEEASASCINVLLEARASHSAKDSRGHTPLHIASTTDADCVAMLLASGADPNALDSNGRTVLHCAVSRGSRAAECVRQLVEAGADVDAQDSFGYSSLHLCAVNESSQCASILLKNGADVTIKTKAGTTALSLLVRRIPDVMRVLVERLDSAVTIHDHDAGDPDCEIRLDFRAIVPNPEKKATGNKGKLPEKSYFHNPRKETEFLTCLLAAGNKKILAHPLSEAFLTLKWQRVRKFFWASLLFQIALITLFTIFIVEVYLMRCPYDQVKSSFFAPEERTSLKNLSRASKATKHTDILPRFFNETDPLWKTNGLKNDSVSGNSYDSNIKIRKRRNTNRESTFSWFNLHPMKRNNSKRLVSQNTKSKDPEMIITTRISPSPRFNSDTSFEENEGSGSSPTMEKEKCILTPTLTVIWCSLVASTFLMGVKEIFQLLQSPFSYIVSSENWGQWALIGSVVLTAWRTPGYHLSYWQHPAAACGIFLAWGLLLLQVGRFPALGVYVQMLAKVAANFGLFILAYACLLIAFALAFCVLFPEYPAYSSVPLAILKVITMMVGEVDYEDLFYNEDRFHDPILYPITAHVLHGAFVIIVTIVLMNLLVGLAVHDIQGLQKGAKLNRLSRQTALVSRLESFIFSKRLQSCLPKSVGSLLQKSALLVPSSYNWSFYFRPNDPRDRRLPKELKKTALRLAASRGHGKHSVSNRDRRFSPVNIHNSKPHMVSTPDIQIHMKKFDQRLDQLQLQMEHLIKIVSDKLELTKIQEKIGADEENDE